MRVRVSNLAERADAPARSSHHLGAIAAETGRAVGEFVAVVADEVRRLAEGSRSAAEGITRLIGLVQHDTRWAVATVARGNEHTAAGTALVDRFQHSLHEIGQAVAEADEQMGEISMSSRQRRRSFKS